MKKFLKKRLTSGTILLLMTVFIVFSLAACSPETPSAGQNTPGNSGNQNNTGADGTNSGGNANLPSADSTGLSFRRDDDGYFVVTGIGTCTDTEIAIPAVYNSLPVREIDKNAFRGNRNITGVYVGTGVLEVDEGAFADCTALRTVDLGGILEIDNDAFSGCTALESLTFPDSLVDIGERAFSGCTSLRDVTFGMGLHDIDKNAFSGCTALSSATFKNPDGWYAGSTQVDVSNASTNAQNLTQNYAAREWEYIGRTPTGTSSAPTTGGSASQPPQSTDTKLAMRLDDDGYYVVTGIGTCTDTEIVIPSVYNSLPVREIDKNAFRGNLNITSVDLGTGIFEIDEGAFAGCTALKTVNFGTNLAEIDDDAFSGCTSLESLTFPDSVADIGERAFSGCTALGDVTFGTGMRDIDRNAFSGCTSLSSVTFKNLNGWYAGSTKVDVSNAATNAQNLTGNYSAREWEKAAF